MSTNLEIITPALRLLGVIGETESPSAEQGSEALGYLNRMLESWTENVIDLGWFEQSSTTDTAPLPQWAEKGVISKLVQDLMGLYPSASPVAWVLDDTRNGYEIIARKAVIEQMTPADMSHMPTGQGHFGSGYDIETDNF